MPKHIKRVKLLHGHHTNKNHWELLVHMCHNNGKHNRSIPRNTQSHHQNARSHHPLKWHKQLQQNSTNLTRERTNSTISSIFIVNVFLHMRSAISFREDMHFLTFLCSRNVFRPRMSSLSFSRKGTL